MNRDDIQHGESKRIAREAYHIIEALDNIERPGDRVLALALVLSVLGDLLERIEMDPKALLTLGDNVRKELKYFSPDTYKALIQYIEKETRA